MVGPSGVSGRSPPAPGPKNWGQEKRRCAVHFCQSSLMSPSWSLDPSPLPGSASSGLLNLGSSVVNQPKGEREPWARTPTPGQGAESGALLAQQVSWPGPWITREFE